MPLLARSSLPKNPLIGPLAFALRVIGVATFTLDFVLSAVAQQPDNTRTDKGDQGTTTAHQQKENAADHDLAKKIRQSLAEDNSFSTYGHNAKVIVRNGEVTLEDPVKSEDEKAAIESKATSWPSGQGHPLSDGEVDFLMELGALMDAPLQTQVPYLL